MKEKYVKLELTEAGKAKLEEVARRNMVAPSELWVLRCANVNLNFEDDLKALANVLADWA